jgi:hypothetical protein
MENLIAYCLKTKSKEEMFEAVVSQTKRGGYMAKGVTKDGHKMSLMMSKANADAAVAAGIAKLEEAK